MTIPSLTTFLLGKQYIGIEHFTLNNEEKVALLLVENKKEGLVIEKKDKVNYTGKIADKWDKKLPFFLIINTNQVIQKEVTGVEASDEKLLHKAFPNTNWDEFYFEIWRLKTKSIVAITRKSYLDDLLSHYAEQKIIVAGISLGICSIAEILNYTNEKKFFTNNQIVITEEGSQIITPSIEDLEATYTINELSIHNTHLLPFSGLLRLITNNTQNTGSSIIHSEALYDNYNQKVFFSKSLKIMIGIVLAILVVNFFCFSHYYKLVQNTSETLLVNESSLGNVSTIKQRIQAKEQKVKSITDRTSSQSSLVINEITKRIPQSILLNELIYDPLVKKIKPEEAIVTEERVITISGTTLDNNAFTNWVETIEKLKWIDNAVITHFGKNDLNETEFSIKLTLK
ncbi:PilN domain-containing protein [Flavobacterium hydatis]|uniref:General secretion pathway protein n=1 Tax=Flavobacterium hydatis TaxID=991 RepID=A0A086A5P4_FLAHY|nr:PilN domain-containing protein [Flavobacterium hydatis]KFF12008.1 general secretion pathway protein [Flavobacterium hydatis]OXA94240.1 general secretion pathway protein [Flavobacterium hydatis]